jgi:phytoene synthase
MEQYTATSYSLARLLTLEYSTSFGQSSKLFSDDIRRHIYAIYGLVRVADEVVDTYKGTDALELITELETHTLKSLKTGFSPNPLVHAFVTTAQRYGIGRDLITPFFKSMRMDLTPQTYTQAVYETYIYGSAEVIGLMCLKVFCDDETQYAKLESGAKALGSAYQKVNFLRDMKSDFEERGRVYFPEINYAEFNDRQKDLVIKDIKKDFKKAQTAIPKLPDNARTAVAISFAYYSELLAKLERTSADKIKASRVRVSAPKKLQLFVTARINKGRI